MVPREPESCRKAAAALFALLLPACAGGAAEPTGSARAAVLTATEVELDAAGRSPTDQFGAAVAISGDSLIVGAPEQVSSSGAGAAYVFLASQAGYALQQKLTGLPLGGIAEDFGYGKFVAIDGDVAVVGGAWAYDVWRRAAGSWTREAALAPSEAGVSLDGPVALSGDAVVVGDPTAAKARTFRRSGSAWPEENVLDSNAPYFGLSVALSGDDLLVGAPGTRYPTLADGSTPSGAVYTTQYDAGAWRVGGILGDGKTGDCFGHSLAIAGDVAVAGRPNGLGAPGEGAGEIVLLRHTGVWPDAWTVTGRLRPVGADLFFGEYLALSAAHLVVGAPHGGQPGQVSVYAPTGQGFTRQLLLVPGVSAAGDDFGQALATAGNVVLVGAPSARKASVFELLGEPTCSADGLSALAADGTLTSCGAYRCAASACLAACTDSAECAAGHVCDSARASCVAASPPGGATSGDSAGCSMRTGSHADPSLVALGLGWVAALRRRRRG